MTLDELIVRADKEIRRNHLTLQDHEQQFTPYPVVEGVLV